MDFIERLSTPPPRRKPGKSVVDEWADTLDPDQRAAVYAAAADERWGHVALRDAFVDLGGPFLSDSSLSTWRKKNGYRGNR